MNALRNNKNRIEGLKNQLSEDTNKTVVVKFFLSVVGIAVMTLFLTRLTALFIYIGTLLPISSLEWFNTTFWVIAPYLLISFFFSLFVEDNWKNTIVNLLGLIYFFVVATSESLGEIFSRIKKRIK